LHGSRSSVNDFDSVCSRSLKTGAEKLCIFFSSNGEQLRIPSEGLLKCCVDIPARSQSNNLKALRIGFNHAKSAAADGASRTEDGNAFHQKSVVGCRSSVVGTLFRVIANDARRTTNDAFCLLHHPPSGIVP
jgi:hypothetical protein